MAVLQKSPLHVQSAGGVGTPTAEVRFPATPHVSCPFCNKHLTSHVTHRSASTPHVACHLLQQEFDQSCDPQIGFYMQKQIRFVTANSCTSCFFAFYISSLWSGLFRLHFIDTLMSASWGPVCHTHSGLLQPIPRLKKVFCCE